MLLNCSNHISKTWSAEQLSAAKKWGEIIDYPFPNVSAFVDEIYIDKYAEDIVNTIQRMQPSAVMCQGEFTLTYAIITKLLQKGIKVFAACSERKVQESVLPDGSVEKKSVFQFVRFREYSLAS